jgi:hypothetical protein
MLQSRERSAVRSKERFLIVALGFASDRNNARRGVIESVLECRFMWVLLLHLGEKCCIALGWQAATCTTKACSGVRPERCATCSVSRGGQFFSRWFGVLVRDAWYGFALVLLRRSTVPEPPWLRTASARARCSVGVARFVARREPRLEPMRRVPGFAARQCLPAGHAGV